MVGLVGLCGRLFEIQITRHKELSAKAREFSSTTRVLEAWRGEVRDRNGRILAVSIPVKTIYTNPALWANRVQQISRTCGSLLNIPPEELAARISACIQRSSEKAENLPKAVVLRRDVNVDEWRAISSALMLEDFGLTRSNMSGLAKAEIQRLRHKLLFATENQIRRYPYETTLSQVLGLVVDETTGIGLKGICGIESAFDKVLAGKAGACVSAQDVAGTEIPSFRTQYNPASNGDNVVLTIDLNLQKVVENLLVAAKSRYQARGACAIVMNPRTFEILAVASIPSCESGNPGASPSETWRNPVFSDRVEPGSTFKLVTLSAALDLGLMNLDSSVYCEQGRFVVNTVPVQDHGRYGLLTLRQGFAKSSNIAFAKTALALGPQRLYNYITNFGFGRCTGISIGGETSGWIGSPGGWSTMTLTRAGFGQGLCVSQLQMAVAMCTIANGGRLMRPLLVSRIESPQGRVLQQFRPQFIRTVVRPQTAQLVLEAMKAVVSPEGTGALAALDRYTVAAKTGTAQKSNEHGYLKDRYYSSMIGCFPADAPQIVIAVALDEPRDGYYAGTVIAPTFRAIAEQTAALLSIPPDKDAPAPAGTYQVLAARSPTTRGHTVTKQGSLGMSGPRQTFAKLEKP